MTALIITIHVIVSIALILIVLLQTGKGASMGAVFGGAGSQALFGNTGAASFLGKLTTWAAIIFMLTSLTLAYISKSGGKSVVSDIQSKPAAQQKQVPAAEKPPVTLPATPSEPATGKTAVDTKPVKAKTVEQPSTNSTPVSSTPATPAATKASAPANQGTPAAGVAQPAETTKPEQPTTQQPKQ